MSKIVNVRIDTPLGLKNHSWELKWAESSCLMILELGEDDDEKRMVHCVDGEEGFEIWLKEQMNGEVVSESGELGPRPLDYGEELMMKSWLAIDETYKLAQRAEENALMSKWQKKFDEEDRAPQEGG